VKWESTVFDLAIQLLQEQHREVTELARAGRVGGEMMTLSYGNQLLWHARVARKQIDGSPTEIQSTIESWQKAATEYASDAQVVFDVDKLTIGDWNGAFTSLAEAEISLARHTNNSDGFLAAISKLVDFRLISWNRVKALNQSGRVGGEAWKEALARLLFEAARDHYRNVSGKEPNYIYRNRRGDNLILPQRRENKDWSPVRVASDDLMQWMLVVFDADRLSLDSVMIAMNHVVDANLAASRGDKELQTNVIPYLHGVIGKCKEPHDAGEALVATGRRSQARQLAANLWIALATLNVMAAESEGRR
jgi:hypothetical protein